MGASRSFVLAFALVCLMTASPLRWRLAAAQTDSLISIDDLVQQDTMLGSGCNAIALGVPMTSAPPISPDQAWLDAHAACSASGLRATGGCYGITDTQQQFELCMFTVFQGDGTTSIDCGDFTLETYNGTYGVSASDTDTLLTKFQQQAQQRNLTQLGTVQSCTTPGVLQPRTFMLTVFPIDPTDDQVALKVNVAPSQWVAFIADGPAIHV